MNKAEIVFEKLSGISLNPFRYFKNKKIIAAAKKDAEDFVRPYREHLETSHKKMLENIPKEVDKIVKDNVVNGPFIKSIDKRIKNIQQFNENRRILLEGQRDMLKGQIDILKGKHNN